MKKGPKEEAVQNDDHGIADDPRPGQQPEASPDARGIEKADDVGIAAEAGDKGIAVDGGKEEGLELEAAIREIASISMEWGGPLPDPGSLKQYDPSVQDKIVEWADRKVTATYDDESRRQDRLVEAEIRQGRNGQAASTFIMVLALVLAAVVGVATGNAVMSGAFLMLPFATIIGNLFKPVASTRKSEKEED